MLVALLVILIILWVLGLLPTNVSIPNIEFFAINGHPITLWNIITLIVISWIIGLIPNPFRTIASVLLVLWVLSILGIFALPIALGSWLIAAIIIGLVFFLIQGVF